MSLGKAVLVLAAALAAANARPVKSQLTPRAYEPLPMLKYALKLSLHLLLR